MSFAGLSGFDGPGGGPFGQGGPPQGTSGVPGEVQGVADFFGGGGAPGFGGEDYFGGGGFLHGGNFLTQAQQPSGPQLSLIPVKIGYGYEMLEAALQTARLQFSLDDFTGRIECEFTVGDELTEFRQNQILDALSCGGLVTIFGSINLLGKSEPSLRVHAIRQTQSAADLIYHESACQVAYLRLKYPGEDPESVASGQQQQLQPPQQPATVFAAPQRLQGTAHSGQAMMPFG